MNLQSITLSNYQGVKDIHLDFGGQSVRVCGANGTGKTTCANAILWLLTGKPVDVLKNYTPKGYDENGGELHNINHSASAVVKLDSGQEVTLEKMYHEIWKKKRGRAETEFSGNTVDYFIDGVPTKEKDYAEFIKNSIAPDELLKILMRPNYFLQSMKWQDRRAKLMELVGELEDEQVIASNPELEDLMIFLKIPGTETRHYSVEEYRKIADATRRKINRRLDLLPELISEAERAIPVLPDGVTADLLQQRVDEKSNDLRELRSRLSWMQSGTGASMEAKEKLADLRSQKENARAAHVQLETEQFRCTYQRLRETDQTLMALDRTIGAEQFHQEQLAMQIQQMTDKRERILKEWRSVAATKWNAGDEICPTCKQRLPADQVAKHRADFNQRRSQQLEALTQKGKREAEAKQMAEQTRKLEAFLKREKQRDMEKQENENTVQCKQES